MIEESGSGMLRLRNGRAVFDRFLRAGAHPVSRTEIARMTGLSKPTVNALVSDLEQAGMVREATASQAPGRIGRPAAAYQLVPETATVVGVDMGATKTLVGVADLLGEVIATERVSTPPHARGGRGGGGGDRRPAVENLGETGARLEGACIGVPGVYRPALDRVEMAPNLPGFADLPIAAELAEAPGVPVAIENDVNLATVGEAEVMTSGAVKDFAVISIGTGIGMGMVVDGELYRGAHGRPARSGRSGCPAWARRLHALTLEDVASAPAIRKLFHRAVEAGRRSRLAGDVDVPAIFSASQEGIRPLRPRCGSPPTRWLSLLPTSAG